MIKLYYFIEASERVLLFIFLPQKRGKGQQTVGVFKNSFLFFAFILFLVGCTKRGISPVRAQYLRCEFLSDPLGVTAVHPRLSWELLSEVNRQSQVAYQIMASTDSMMLVNGRADLWNSGRIQSHETNQISYDGRALLPGMICYWKVRIWDQNGRKSDWSPIAYWSEGLLQKGNVNHGIWRAQWIGAPFDTTTILYPIHPRFGFHTEFSQKPNAVKWVVLDLGKMEEINGIRLYPADLSGINAAGYLFPTRFRIDVSDNPGFEPFKTVIDETKKDVPDPGNSVWERSFQTVRARYVRLFITKLAPENKKAYAASLAEFEVLHHGKNVALNAVVTASDTLVNNNDNGGWNISYITDGFTRSSYIPKMEPSPPSPLLRKQFSISGKVKRAFLYISALGLYQVVVNGKEVGDHILAPEWTDYRKHVQYQTYNVTPLLKDGENVIGAMLADGWYVGPLMTNPQRGVYGINRRLIAQLEIEKEDGSWETICTDSSWKVYLNGPVRSASIYNGETYNGNFAIKDWSTPHYHPGAHLSKWNKATVDTTVHVLPVSQRDQPVKIIGSIKPVRIIHPRKDVYIFDMGQNFAGWCQINLPEYEGQQIVLHHGEMLNKDSTLYIANLRGAKQVDSFSAPPGPVSYEPRFTYHGFRYVSVSGLRHRPGLSMVTGKVISSSDPQTGYFSCSDSLLNRLWENILWTQRSNTMGVPTDCPQRDERMGWMGDAQVFSQTAIFNRDMSSFYTKWMQDIRDGQLADGRFPDYSPALNTSFSYYNAPGWADAAVVIPWRLYINYNDKSILKEQYSALKKYNAFIKKMNPDLIWKNGIIYNYGDWLNGDWVIAKDYPKTGGSIPEDVYSTAFFAHSTQLIAKIAASLGKDRDEKYYSALYDSIKQAFNSKFVNPENGMVKGNCQAGYALALKFHLLADSVRALALKNMIDNIHSYGDRMSTGFQASVRMMDVLVNNGHEGLAYLLLESQRMPSWLYSVDQGATTIWERWDGYVKGRGFQSPGMNSFNHYAFGSVGQWMYEHILGIQPDEKQPGYRHFIIHPVPGGDLKWAEGSYHSINGLIVSDWKREDNHFTLQIEIPVNTTATVYVPMWGNKHRERMDGIKFLHYDNDEAVYLVRPGKYILKNF